MNYFSHNPEVNIRNNSSKLTPAKFRNLILTELGNDTKDIFQNEIKEHLKNKTLTLDHSGTESYLKEINILKEELIQKEALIKELIETIRKFTTNSLKWDSHHPKKYVLFESLLKMIKNVLYLILKALFVLNI